ncbi:MAG: tetratricopeptide repeat protein [Planctomycetales bacterium]
MSVKSFVRIGIGPAAFLACLALAAAPASADRVYRKSSPAPLSGDLALSKDQVTVTPRVGNATTVSTDDIDRIEWDGEPPMLRLARADEALGKLPEALAKYEAEFLKTSGNAKTDTQFLIARTTAKLALANPPQLQDAITKLDAFRGANPNHVRFYPTLELLGEAYLANDEFDKARTVYSELEQAAAPTLRLGARNAKARVLLKEGKTAEALAAFDAVIGEPAQGPAEQSRRYEAMLGRAGCLMTLAKYGEAVAALDAVIDEVAPEDSRNQATAYVLKGDCLRALDKDKDALLAYLHVDVLFAHERPQHAEALYNLARLWGQVDNQDRANDAAARLSSAYPNSPWAKKLSSG